jgi:hypothetical protein
MGAPYGFVDEPQKDSRLKIGNDPPKQSILQSAVMRTKPSLLAKANIPTTPCNLPAP